MTELPQTAKTEAGAAVLCADASDILTAILDLAPVPKDSPAKRAMWLKETAAAVKTVFKAIDLEYRIALDSLVDSGVDDSRYEVIPLMKTEREIDKEALRSTRPTLYEQLAFIDADTAMEILGKKTLRQLILERTSPEMVCRLDSVNVLPFEKLCRECGEDAAAYITELTVPNGYLLREITAAETGGA